MTAKKTTVTLHFHGETATAFVGPDGHQVVVKPDSDFDVPLTAAKAYLQHGLVTEKKTNRTTNAGSDV